MTQKPSGITTTTAATPTARNVQRQPSVRMSHASTGVSSDHRLEERSDSEAEPRREQCHDGEGGDDIPPEEDAARAHDGDLTIAWRGATIHDPMRFARTLIGMVHLAPLPGSPRWAGS